MTAITQTRTAAGPVPAAAVFPLRLRGLRTIVGALLAGAMATGFPTAAAAGDLVIGVAGPMSGPLASAGKQYRAAAELAAKEMNASGGLNGDRLVIVPADDEATPKGGRAAAKVLAAKKVSVVIGHYNSTPAMAAAETYTQNEVLLIAPQAIIGKLTDAGAWNVFRLAPRDDTQAAAAAAWLARRAANRGGAGSKRIAIVHDTSAFGRSLAELAGKALAKSNIAPALSGEIPPGTRQTQLIVNQLADRIATARTGAVYWTGGSAVAGRFLTALRKRKSQALFVGTEVLAAREFINGMDPDAIAGAHMTLPGNRTGEAAKKALLEKLDIDPGKEDASPAVAAWAAMQVLLQAAKATGANDPRRIARAMHSGTAFRTIIGPISFDARGERREQLYRMYRWQKAEDGKLTFVQATDAASRGGQ